MTHEKEICRWAKMPDGTNVWVKDIAIGKWELTDNPKWLAERIYIVDDEHAELCKQFIDDKSKVEFNDRKKGWIPTIANSFREFTTLLYGREDLYRIKPKINYLWCWVWTESGEHKEIRLIEDLNIGTSSLKKEKHKYAYWKYAVPLDPQPEFKGGK